MILHLLTRLVPSTLLITLLLLHPPLQQQVQCTMTLCLVSFFLLLPQNCIVVLNIYKQRSRVELPFSLLMLHIFLFNLVNGPLIPADPLAKIVSVCFLVLLGLNVFTYSVSLVVYLCFALYLLFNLLSNPPMVEQLVTGLNQSEVKRLKKIKVPNKETESSSENLCSICQVDFIPGEEVLEMPMCLHYYHTDCILPWLKKNIICPLCRSDVRANLPARRTQR